MDALCSRLKFLIISSDFGAFGPRIRSTEGAINYAESQDGRPGTCVANQGLHER